ncbi:uncharacterized protein BDCG_17019 [Blastomyces dermatitidis ER-3]|nr:uncharacterized protein BDCG_17019 [Blastomyces dermatitidis ER-3]OAT01293.1 hypothetical protein BDCG_17019 [Blastomyces dermatitidis ER-3]
MNNSTVEYETSNLYSVGLRILLETFRTFGAINEGPLWAIFNFQFFFSRCLITAKRQQNLFSPFILMIILGDSLATPYMAYVRLATAGRLHAYACLLNWGPQEENKNPMTIVLQFPFDSLCL